MQTCNVDQTALLSNPIVSYWNGDETPGFKKSQKFADGYTHFT
jgi:hypothetical protein